MSTRRRTTISVHVPKKESNTEVIVLKVRMLGFLKENSDEGLTGIMIFLTEGILIWAKNRI